jgi:hypothetical protein
MKYHRGKKNHKKENRGRCLQNYGAYYVVGLKMCHLQKYFDIAISPKFVVAAPAAVVPGIVEGEAR